MSKLISKLIITYKFKIIKLTITLKEIEKEINPL